LFPVPEASLVACKELAFPAKGATSICPAAGWFCVAALEGAEDKEGPQVRGGLADRCGVPDQRELFEDSVG
jgi:hypothetical protein